MVFPKKPSQARCVHTTKIYLIVDILCVSYQIINNTYEFLSDASSVQAVPLSDLT